MRTYSFARISFKWCFKNLLFLIWFCVSIDHWTVHGSSSGWSPSQITCSAHMSKCLCWHLLDLADHVWVKATTLRVVKLKDLTKKGLIHSVMGTMVHGFSILKTLHYIFQPHFKLKYCTKCTKWFTDMVASLLWK